MGACRIGVIQGILLVLCGCNGGAVAPGTDVLPADTAQELGPVCMTGGCTTPADCDPLEGCVESVGCIQGCCQYSWLPAGTQCHEGCLVDGLCSESGACLGTVEMTCVEEDGNPCTVPGCDRFSGTCVEEALPNGESLVSSHCWDGIVCTDGAPDDSAATPTTLALECQAAADALDPWGCTADVICVDSEEECAILPRADGTPCWVGAGEGDDETCAGRSCQEGQCVPDPALDVTCGEEDYPGDCDLDCRVCTSLSCHWIPDPANPGAVNQVRYCRPEALVGEECDDGSGCTVGDTCILGPTADGPLGKETLGLCQPGEGKTKEECLADLDLPALPCLKAGMGCDPEAGCALDQDAADAWCLPPGQVCVNLAQTWCTHLDINDGKWNAETGCHLVLWAETCDDGAFCSEDLCDPAQGCSHPPKDDGTPCGEDLECQDGLCVVVCVPSCAGKICGDDGCGGSCGTCSDGNPCSLDVCQAGGTCTFPAGNEGVGCLGAGLCSGKCQGGSCVETAAEVCNGWDDDCDDQVDEGEICPPGSSCSGGMCLQDCTPLNGDWTDWSCGACSAPCGGGTWSCSRSCTNPPPSCGGAQCAGSASKIEACNAQPCSDTLPVGTTSLHACETITTGKVPVGVTSIQLKLWGGGGGGGAPGGGGGGAFVQGTLAVSPGDSLELRVACGGEKENGGGGASYVLKNGVVVMVAAGGGGGGSDGCSGCHKTSKPDAGAGGGGGAL
ncbi:MAG: thrombospondin type-1 domain-containing protein, partial [Deltaproteobacteria bacterium]|nr:thrombospondin type-1 domain-containing protein [Deltaproteobacteria bacterium]